VRKRGGVHPDSGILPELAARLGPSLAGVMTHAGHSYAGRSVREIERIAEAERGAITRAAQRLRDAGHPIGIVSAGEFAHRSPRGEMAGGDGNSRRSVHVRRPFPGRNRDPRRRCDRGDVLTSVIRPPSRQNPGRCRRLALSKDRSTEATPHDYGYGLALDVDGTQTPGACDRPQGLSGAWRHRTRSELARSICRFGARLRIAPNHTCMTAAAHDRYFVGGREQDVAAIWHRGERLVDLRLSPLTPNVATRVGRS